MRSDSEAAQRHHEVRKGGEVRLLVASQRHELHVPHARLRHRRFGDRFFAGMANDRLGEVLLRLR